jgi:hypothetical protein
MVIDRAFDHSLPQELSTGFDYTIVDEGLDRVMFTPWDMPLNLLADHHFDQHPVLTEGQPDDALTQEARTGYARSSMSSVSAMRTRLSVPRSGRCRTGRQSRAQVDARAVRTAPPTIRCR